MQGTGTLVGFVSKRSQREPRDILLSINSNQNGLSPSDVPRLASWEDRVKSQHFLPPTWGSRENAQKKLQPFGGLASQHGAKLSLVWTMFQHDWLPLGSFIFFWKRRGGTLPTLLQVPCLARKPPTVPPVLAMPVPGSRPRWHSS